MDTNINLAISVFAGIYATWITLPGLRQLDRRIITEVTDGGTLPLFMVFWILTLRITLFCE